MYNNIKWEDALQGNEGGFMKKLAELYEIADKKNREKIEQAFPYIAKSYIKWFEG